MSETTMDGDPYEQAPYWQEQTQNEDCMEMSTADIIGQVTGDQPTEQQITTLAGEQPSDTDPGSDIYSVQDGSSLKDDPELFNDFGIQAQYTDSTDSGGDPTGMTALEQDLSSGDRVIAGVDGEKIWDAEGLHKADPDTVDHAVVVTGVDPTDGVVYLNDSGIASGEQEAVPISTFEKSWSPGKDEMVVVNDPSGQPTTTTTTPTNEYNPFAPASNDTPVTPGSPSATQQLEAEAVEEIEDFLGS